MHPLDPFGWCAHFATALEDLNEPRLEPARVLEEHRTRHVVRTATGELDATPSGRLRHAAAGAEDLPAVGDWVGVTARPDEGAATIHRVLPRRTALLRKSPDRRTAAQVVAANLDTVFVVCSLNLEFNPRRIERYVTLVWESGAQPAVLLTKADLCPDPVPFAAQVEDVAVGVPVHVLSSVTGDGMDALERHLRPRTTAALVGSSGVGKSTLINALVGEERMVTRAIREDDARGRHTTTHRQLVPLPGGALLIDTPGMRELALWDAGGGIDTTFGDIEQIMAACRFGDCSHASEPGCAVRAALDDGSLDAGRYDSFRRLQRELAHLERRQDEKAWLEKRRRVREFSRLIRDAKDNPKGRWRGET